MASQSNDSLVTHVVVKVESLQEGDHIYRHNEKFFDNLHHGIVYYTPNSKNKSQDAGKVSFMEKCLVFEINKQNGLCLVKLSQFCQDDSNKKHAIRKAYYNVSRVLKYSHRKETCHAETKLKTSKIKNNIDYWRLQFRSNDYLRLHFENKTKSENLLKLYTIGYSIMFYCVTGMQCSLFFFLLVFFFSSVL